MIDHTADLGGTQEHLSFTADLSGTADLSPMDLAVLTLPTGPGDSRAPGYELQEKIGGGSFGEVWRALQMSTGQPVAVKIFKSVDPAVLRELERIVRLGSHPYLISILDAKLNNDPPFMVTSLLQGSLSAWMKVHAHAAELNLRVSAWLRQAALALSYVHRRGVFHCDIKPQNLLLDSQEVLRLADFGQAQSSGTSARLGTFFCMPPDQVLAAKAHGFSKGLATWDIYALGATFYYLLTSYYPRATPSGLRKLEHMADLQERLKEYWIQLQRCRLVPIAEYNPGVETRLAMIIERCLALDPGRRYQDAAELVADLELWDRVRRNSLDEVFYFLRCAAHRLGM